MSDLVEYSPGKVASLTMAQKPGVNLSVLALDKGEGLATHSAPGDALACILEGEAHITIGDEMVVVRGGQSVVMPAGVPHSLKAATAFKMFLVLVKKTE